MVPLIEVLLLLAAFIIVGTGLGVFTGLTPGIHVNNVAIVLLSLSPFLAKLLSDISGLESWTALLLVSAAIVATSMAHTFLDFIPSTFLGAPEPETALSVLPAHGMLMKGEGYQAVYISALGSFGAVVVGFILLVPYRFLVNEPLNGYDLLKEYMVWALLAVVILVLVSETAKLPYRPVMGANGHWQLEKGPLSRVMGVAAASCLFLLSGALGLAVFDLDVSSPFGLPASVLFPTLSGLFGTSTLLESIRGGAKVPPQRAEDPDLSIKDAVAGSSIGGTAGSVVGFLPGMSGGVATVIAMIFRKDNSPGSVILTLSAINTANSFFVVAALFLILRPRSGAAIVVDELIQVTEWNSVIPPFALSILMIASLAASCMGFFLTLYLGKRLSNLMPRVPYGPLAFGIIVFITLMVIVFTGPLGLLVLAVSTGIGLIAPFVGIRRSHAMGVLLVPVITMFW